MVQRVLHIVGRMDRAGAETMVMNLYREIDRSRFQFDFVYFTDDRCDHDDEVEALGGRIVRVGGGNSASRFLNLWRVLCKGQWSIVQSHMLFSNGLHLLAAKLAGVPRRIAHSHNTSDANSQSAVGRLYQRLMRWLLFWVPTNYVACGTAAAAYLFPGRSGVQIIPNAIDITRFAEVCGADCRKYLDVGEETVTILQVGRLMPVKNHTLSVLIAAALHELGADFKMVFVGDGPEYQAIGAQIKKYGLETKVHLLGLREDIPELMSAADVLLMPSFHEGFPVVLVETQAAGLRAVISSTISPEVDLGLGLVEFINLDAPPEVWASKVLVAARAGVVSADTRRQALQTHGFSARTGAERLTSLYVAS